MRDLIQFCKTDRQREIINAIIECGSQRKAADHLGVARGTVSGIIEKVKSYSSSVEYSDRCATEGSNGYRRHFFLPDVQAKPNVPLDHLKWAGKYVAEKRPDVIICIGDFADMPSLSLYDRGKKSFEGRRYKADIAAAHDAMERFMTPIVQAAGYKPEMVLTLGNHEHRIFRATEDDSKLDGTIGIGDLGYAEWGWDVVPFLEVREIDGINYSHYFYNPNSGKPYAGTAHTKLKNIGLSFAMGHQQGFDIATRELPNGKRQFGIVAGSFYQHVEEYKGPQGNGHWQGCLMLNECKDGECDAMPLSLDYLRRKFG